MIGTQELILILIVVLFIFGPSKLPELARSLGKAAGEFKRAQVETELDIKRFNKPPDDKDIKIHNLAIEMGIDVKNKTSEQLVEEIRFKIRSKEKLDMKTAGVYYGFWTDGNSAGSCGDNYIIWCGKDPGTCPFAR
ncbi:MAG: twin-arginine translocase TatA/TatE family subunit [Candidatus Methanoperedens sp.]|nr:twin-arginine translocase TatA/TatE family subunit [Candidatus Methanoperedens sp.]